jgi:hypothetical protein
MIDPRDSPDIRLSTEPNEPTDSTDAHEPTEPTDSTEPTEPMDRTEFVEAIDSSERRDRMLHREVLSMP